MSDREWIACADFTVADILVTCVLREIRKTELLKSYPRLADYYARALTRPAWKRALASYSKLLGKNPEDIL